MQKYPGDMWARRALIALGECHREIRDWPRAIEAYQRLIKAYPDSREATDAQLLLGHTLVSAGRYQDAVRAYQVITDDDKGRWSTDAIIEAWFQMGQAYSKLGQHEDAALAYLRIATVYAAYSPANALIAMVQAASEYEGIQKFYDARNWYERAIKDYGNAPNKTPQMEQALKYAKTHLDAVNAQIRQLPSTNP